MNRLLCILLVGLLQVTASVAATFRLDVEVTPQGSGSLNTSGGTYEEGASVYLRTYNNTGYIFKGWYEGEELVSSTTSFNYTMPQRDVRLQAKYEFDPTVPGNPAMPDTTTYYQLTATVSPVGAGTLNTYEGRYAYDAKVSMRTYSNTGYRFLGWQNETGTMVSTNTSFSYAMPRHDSHLTAMYEFDPSVPSNPDSMATNYTVYVKCKPVGGGSFNNSAFTSAEGSNVRIYAYTNTGYKFIHWEDESGKVIATDQNFYYVIPHSNSTIYGVFEFDPAVPSNPNKNYWNKELGELIIDDFTTGSLNSAVSSAINGSSSNDVTMITVAGRMDNNDFGIANNYKNCTLLDLSRVTGVTGVPSYAFDGTNLETVYLPATIEKIGDRAFENCKQLAALTLYSMTPPTLGNNVFRGIPEGLIVYVPAASIAQYQDAEGWKDFTILPIQEDIRSITIAMPEGITVSDFNGMWLEMTNTKSGQRLHYVMTDRQQYTFSNIIRNTTWNIQLRNERGDVFGMINNVEVKDEDVSVTFDALQKPQTVTLSVLTPDGTDVTGKTQVTWLDTDGNYLVQSASMGGLCAGKTLSYHITLPQELAMAYVLPTQAEYTVVETSNNVVCTLEAIAQVALSGKVMDVTTRSPLNGAVVSASQTFAGKYSKTVSAKTDAQGNYALTVLDVPTTLSIASSDYISQTIVCDSLMNGSNEIKMQDVALKPITGATIAINFTYRPSVAEGEETEVQEWYSDYNNVSYNIYNKTKAHAISQFNVQYPRIVLLEEVDEDDVLKLTATSVTSSFVSVKSEATIDAELHASATFDIVALGGIKAQFKKTDNATVVGTLYDSKGKLVKSYNYTNAVLNISSLADGNYTLVTMGTSTFFNNVYDLAGLPQTGLEEGKDYVKSAVEVKSGVVTVVDIEEVPQFDESQFYYTGDNTSFTVNKPSIVAGNYLTLTARIDFKQAYASSVSNLNLIVDLPESSQFVENSVMVGNSTSSYTLDGNRLTIPVARNTDRIRFCVIPTLGGDYAPSAFVGFVLNGEEKTQPIGTVYYKVKDLTINVPSIVAKPSVPITGTAIGASSIEIFDNGILIGRTTSLASGAWSAMCELDKPYNLSEHKIYAKVTTKQGLNLVSEVQNLVYNINAIEPKSVTMTFYNGWLHKNVDVVFDFITKSTSTSSYMFYTATDITFIADLTNNDTTIVSDVIINVFTDRNEVRNLEAKYDSKIDRWVAVGRFESNNLPVNVNVEINAKTLFILDSEEINNTYAVINNYMKDLFVVEEKAKGINSAILEELQKEQPDLAKTDSLFNKYDVPLCDGVFDSNLYDMSDEEFDEYIKKLSMNIDNIILGTKHLWKEIAENYESQKSFEFSLNGNSVRIEISEPYTNSALTLLTDGYTKIPTTTNYEVYEKYTESNYIRIDLERGLCIKMDINPGTKSPRKFINSPVSGEELVDICKTILDCISNLTNLEAKLNWFLIWYRGETDAALKAFLLEDQNVCNAIRTLDDKILSATGFKKFALIEQRLGLLAKRSAMTAEWVSLAESQKATIKCVGAAIGGILNLITCLKTEHDNCVKIANMSVPYCLYQYAPDIASGFENEIEGLFNYVRNWALWTVGRIVLYTAGDIVLSETVVIPIVLSVVELAAEIYYSRNKQREFDSMLRDLERRMQKSKEKYCKDGPNPKPNPNPTPNPPFDPLKPIHDPSGYVYEAVSTNRLEGVMATCFYKETVEDMYGDLHENIVKWDAEEYAQENPLFTDENGMYAWDVPQGLWQVKFEKEGYETTYSDWLPVPPPQLEVNIAMKQNIQPNVKAAHGYEDAVELEFDKYMMPELLTADNIIIQADGQTVEGTVQLLNEEVSYEGKNDTYASKIRFNATEPFAASEVSLRVSNRVKSYAGVRMQDDYMQTFTVEKELSKIVCDSAINVIYGDTVVVPIAVMPAVASAGKTLTVRTSSAMILSLDETKLPINEEGMAYVTVVGELPGTSALTFSVEDSKLTATTIVNVVKKEALVVAEPKASIASGTVVEKGTKLYLSCETEGATIYYTTDGSCPCDLETAKVYDGTPIIINETVTIKAIAMKQKMYDSDIVEFTYTLIEDDAVNTITIDDDLKIYPLPVRDKLNISAAGKTINLVTVVTLNGSTALSVCQPTKEVQLDVHSLTPGIYIINVSTADKIYNRKVLKIE